jgi:hypothetical protein
MKNLKTKTLLLVAIIFALTSCQDKNKTAKNSNNSVKKTEKTSEVRPFLDSVENNIIVKAQSEAINKKVQSKEKIAAEAVTAVVETQKALQLLLNNKTDLAKSTLKNVIKKLKDVATKYPELNLIPVDVNIKTNDLITDIKTVKKISKDAEKALKNDNLQTARELLTGLMSEIDITTVNIPVETYPSAVKSALKLIQQNKIEDAKITLMSELDKLVIETETMPIPLLKANLMLDEAKTKFLEDRSQNKAVVDNLLNSANYQLKLADALGYGNKDTMYEELNKDVENLRESVKSNTKAGKLFDEIKQKLVKLKEKL